MLFHTLDYLVFLPVVVALYWGLPRPARIPLLAFASLVFYGAWSLAYLPVLLGVITVSWAGGLWVESRRRADGSVPAPDRLALLALLCGPLLFFKYWDWVAENLEVVGGWMGLPAGLPRVDLPLPVGISFFTFQALAYVIDVWRPASLRGGAPERSLVRYFTFIAWFPQLVAGPIVRRDELLPQLANPPLLSQGQVGAGVWRLARGVLKKVVFADILRVGIVDPVFADPGRFTGVEVWIALYAYTLQIYYDFSAYTDMAIGSARLFGIELPENFDRPYKATSVAEFWRRWHITLSNWVRDYIYFPLGGARPDAGEGWMSWRVTRNILATLLIIGVWHGASWNFVVYGLLHGCGVALNRSVRKRTGRRPGDPLPGAWAWLWRWALTFHFIVVARVLFRAPDLVSSWAMVQQLDDLVLLAPRFSLQAWLVLLLGYLIHFSPTQWSTNAETWFKGQATWLWVLVAAATAIACVQLGQGDALSFIYFEF